jgi:hypothetical protein
VRERIEYRFRVPSAAVFTLYSYSKVLEYRFRVPTAGSLKILSDGTFDRADSIPARAYIRATLVRVGLDIETNSGSLWLGSLWIGSL